MANKANVWVGQLCLETASQSFRKALEQVSNQRGQVNNRSVRSIAIKINICDYRRAESGAITHPLLLAALLDVLRENYPGASLTIIENDATTVDMWAAYRLLGFDLTAREHGAELRNVAEGKWLTKPVPGGMILKELEVPEILETCDLFVNFAKLKTNALTKMTGCLKNIFALLRMKRKVILHGQINPVLQDMNKVIVPDLCLVDGYIGMEGMGGPAFGRPKRCELLIAGSNPVAVDACCARIMGFRPRSVEHIKLCHQAGLGPMDYQLQTDVPNFDYRRFKFQFPVWEYQLRNLVRNRAGAAA
jgi:uncharacterized protein (DUF362 family)